MKFFGINVFDSSREEKLKVKQFHMTMEVANQIALENPHALRDLVHALIRPLQSECILAVAERADREAPDKVEGSSFFFSDRELFSHTKHYLRDAPKLELNLASDPILPTPWRRDGFVNALANIGVGKKLRVWEQDSNHMVSLWLPWGIGFVGGGNHSISSGILSGENIPIVANEVYDFSPVLDIVECNGVAYKSRKTGKVLAKVADHRRAAVFEIGRLMVKHSVTIAVKQ